MGTLTEGLHGEVYIENVHRTMNLDDIRCDTKMVTAMRQSDATTCVYVQMQS